MKKYITFKNVVIALLVILAIIFVAQNAEVVEVKLWFWTVSTPRSVVIFSSILIGVVIGIFIDNRWFHSKPQDDAEEYANEPLE